MDVEAYLRRRYESQIADIEILDKEDLDLVSDFIFNSQLHKLYPSFIVSNLSIVQLVLEWVGVLVVVGVLCDFGVSFEDSNMPRQSWS